MYPQNGRGQQQQTDDRQSVTLRPTHEEKVEAYSWETESEREILLSDNVSTVISDYDCGVSKPTFSKVNQNTPGDRLK